MNKVPTCQLKQGLASILRQLLFFQLYQLLNMPASLPVRLLPNESAGMHRKETLDYNESKSAFIAATMRGIV